MSAVCQPLFVDDRFPMSPGRAVAEVRATMVPGDVVVADPGPAGLWVARAFSTVTLGSVVVPATVEPGFAAAAALAAGLRRPRRPAVAVTAGPIGPETVAAVEAARSLGVPLVLEVWGEAPDAIAADVRVTGIDHHREALLAARAGDGVTVLHVPVDFADTAKLVAVAGPVVAWPELAPAG
jgi:acetolactate synthase-1/2/3 large subunit